MAFLITHINTAKAIEKQTGSRNLKNSSCHHGCLPECFVKYLRKALPKNTFWRSYQFLWQPSHNSAHIKINDPKKFPKTIKSSFNTQFNIFYLYFSTKAIVVLFRLFLSSLWTNAFPTFPSTWLQPECI